MPLVTAVVVAAVTGAGVLTAQAVFQRIHPDPQQFDHLNNPTWLREAAHREQVVSG
ncbi:hypothetical protein [Streptomyces sp. NPDC126514]|uniref:hypothetical protein n=1 Tax=Streptomyces sp. NPDC126514 TaxID=3155210 RepID=UPI00331D9384